MSPITKICQQEKRKKIFTLNEVCFSLLKNCLSLTRDLKPNLKQLTRLLFKKTKKHETYYRRPHRPGCHSCSFCKYFGKRNL